MKRFELIQAKTVDEAIKALPELGTDTDLKAGGIDFLTLMKERLIAPKKVVNLLKAEDAELRKIEISEKSAKIGALVTLAEVASHEKLMSDFTAVAKAAGEAASPQVRNVATVGGNLCQRPRCWYFRSADFNCLKKGGNKCFAIEGENQYHAIFGDSKCPIVHPSNVAPALIALEGTIHYQSPAGKKIVDAEEFFKVPENDLAHENILKDNEIVTAIEIPASGYKSTFIEVRERQTFDWPLVAVAAALKIDGDKIASARIVLGAVAPKPWRIASLEKEIQGKSVKDLDITKAVADVLSKAKPLSNNGYKVTILKSLIPRALTAVVKS